MSDPLVAAVARNLDYAFTDAALLRRACTHASACNPQMDEAERLALANERMEFLGDALLGAATAESLYLRYPDANEGRLSRYKAQLVSRATLARAFDQLELLEHCELGPQLQQLDEVPVSVRANIMEAVLCAIYEDGGWRALRDVVELMLDEFVVELSTQGARDPKSRLQTWALRSTQTLPDYQTNRSGGSDHDPRFQAEVRVGKQTGTGEGSSRRAAEMAAAEDLLRRATDRERP